MSDLTFKINGADYRIPSIGEFINSFTIDECGIFDQWTGVLIEDIEEAPITSKMIAAFMQIAYMRGNPGISPTAARNAVGASNLASAFAEFVAARESEDDAGPPAQKPSEPEPNGSPGNKPDAKQSSGNGSTASSVVPINAPRPSGFQPWEPSVTSGSATSAS